MPEAVLLTEDAMVKPIGCMLHSFIVFVTKAPREGASFITSQSELGVIRGGCGWGGGPELGKTLLPKGLVFWPEFGPFG